MLSIVVGKPSQDTAGQTESPPKETANPTPVVAKARQDGKCLFIMLYKVVLTFQSVDETIVCDHSNETY